jgi:hypothetical protein
MLEVRWDLNSTRPDGLAVKQLDLNSTRPDGLAVKQLCADDDAVHGSSVIVNRNGSPLRMTLTVSTSPLT